MKQLLASSDSAELGLLASRLEAAGIACEVRGESQVIPGIPFGPELWILRDEDLPAAAQLLADWQNPLPQSLEELENPELEERGDWSDALSVDSVVGALYATISGPAGIDRDWGRFRNLFCEGARLLRTVVDGATQVQLSAMDVEGFIEFASPYFQANPFYEREIFRKVDQFGQMAHVLSTFDSSSDPEGKYSLGRGINSIQLWCDGQRWWVINMMWDDEREGNPIPEWYLPR